MNTIGTLLNKQKTILDKIKVFTEMDMNICNSEHWYNALGLFTKDKEVISFLKQVDFKELKKELGEIHNGYELADLTNIIFSRHDIPAIDLISWSVKYEFNLEEMFPLEKSRYQKYLENVEKSQAIELLKQFTSDSISSIILSRQDFTLDEALNLLIEIHPGYKIEHYMYDGTATLSAIVKSKNIHPGKLMYWIIDNIKDISAREVLLFEWGFIEYIIKYKNN